jgi:ABC-2 type transport system ATP-binding protein
LAILDEPTAGLDPEGINQILDLIAGLPKMDTTVVMCSHRLYEVQRICHSIAILANGKLVVEGALDVLGREALAGGRYMIEVETAEASPQLVEIIGQISGVRNVEAKGNFLHITTDSDLRAAISKAVVNNGVALIQVKVQEFSLDDVYKKYFQEG